MVFGLGGMMMGNGERSESGGRSDWRIRVAGGVGGAAAAAVGLMWRPDLGGFWPGLIAFVAVLAVGIVLGQLAGRLLFRPSPGGPPEDKKRS